MMYAKITEQLRNAGVAKLADAPDLGSGASRREGSSPSTRTKRDCRMKLFAIAYSPFLFHV